MLRVYVFGAVIGVVASLATAIVAAAGPLDLDPKTSGAMAFVFWYSWYTSTRTIPKLIHAFRAESRRWHRNEAANRQAFLTAIEKFKPTKPDD